ncbi:uncharacterized protein LOC118434004 [Folsomia candida]|uniref:uncharacterized protein LOC118434004 n=1 Tax=Folsomia candida TaxID=158441 RepID=UPI0016053AC3|nr:uncharacterized protein LOC118434004 [Folsomia candida]
MVIIPLVISLPTLAAIIVMWSPCTPPVITMALTSCKSWSDDGDVSWVEKGVLSVVEFYAWAGSSGAVIFLIWGCVLYPVIIVEAWVNRLSRKMRFRASIFIQYRLCQYMSGLWNFVLRTPCMPICVAGTIFCQVISLYIVIGSNNLPIMIIMGAGVLGVDMFILIHVVFRIFSIPYLVSTEFLKSKFINSRSKWLKRFFNSCAPLKVSGGNGIFFDRMTSLEIWKVCVDQLVTLLLM